MGPQKTKTRPPKKSKEDEDDEDDEDDNGGHDLCFCARGGEGPMRERKNDDACRHGALRLPRLPSSTRRPRKLRETSSESSNTPHRVPRPMAVGGFLFEGGRQ